MSFTEVSLAVLYLLQEARVALNMEQIAQGLESAAAGTYLDTALAVNDLTDKGFLRAEDTPMAPLYSLTVEGRVNLSHLV
ncbi:MAG: DUF4364 family protein, partial [Clostridia bacterium]|nr:DUF4364 family protein [Clostridia bacterium]